MNIKLALGLTVWLTLVSGAWGADIPEEARRHSVRGRTALEMGQSMGAYREARLEFAKAVELAPNWADAHYNLAHVQAKLGDLNGAIASYSRYLELAPRAPDAQKVRDEIVKLEYQKERLERESPFLRHQAMLTEGGIGAGIKLDAESGAPRLALVAAGSPAEQAGLQAGDRLLAVDGKATTGLREDEIIKLVRGEPGTAVRLSIQRDGWDRPREFSVPRLRAPVGRFLMSPPLADPPRAGQ
ncbi:MAG: PDZ domain-containing protein [Pseudomonadota bacterium]